MTDLLLVGSDHLFRQALAIVIEESLPDCRVLAQADVVAEALQLMAEGQSVDGALVDLHSRTEDPVGLVMALRWWRPEIAVLALTERATGHLTAQLHQAGAAHVIDKSQSLAAVLDGVSRLCSISSDEPRRRVRRAGSPVSFSRRSISALKLRRRHELGHRASAGMSPAAGTRRRSRRYADSPWRPAPPTNTRCWGPFLL